MLFRIFKRERSFKKKCVVTELRHYIVAVIKEGQFSNVHFLDFLLNEALNITSLGDNDF